MHNNSMNLESKGWNWEEAKEIAYNQAMNEFESNTRLGIQLMLKYKEIAAEEGLVEYKPPKQSWFITIRPKTSDITFKNFMDKVMKFVQRKCFIKYTLSFEQKGTSDETLGDGFHVHIIAEMKQRSKGEVLRDTVSTFSGCTAAHCIQVAICKNPEALKDGYLLNYESEDNHKIVTKEWDSKWRSSLGLANIYESSACQNQVQVGTQNCLTIA